MREGDGGLSRQLWGRRRRAQAGEKERREDFLCARPPCPLPFSFLCVSAPCRGLLLLFFSLFSQAFSESVLGPLDAYLAELDAVAKMRTSVEKHRTDLDHYTRKVRRRQETTIATPPMRRVRLAVGNDKPVR